MASSQVETASPFGCVLKDSNKRSSSSRENNNARAAAFQKNLKELVRDHFHSRISISADDNENENESSKNQHDSKIDSRVAKQQGNKKQQQPQHNRNLRFLSNHHNGGNNENKRSFDDSDITTSSRQSRMLDRWAARQAREMVSSIEKQSKEAEQFSSSSTSSGNKDHSLSSTNVGNLGASSLVQIWEARLNRSKSMNMSMSRSSNSNSESSSSRTSSPGTDDPSRDSEMEDSLNSMNHSNQEDSCTEWDSQSDRTAQNEEPSQGRNLDAAEKERVRVADIIKKLTSANEENENENEMAPNPSESPSKEQQRGLPLPLVVNSPKIRGRQAFADLLLQLQRDRHRELDSLLERQAVSRFTYRGRIQAMLRSRFLQRGLVIQDQLRASPAKLLPQGSNSIMHLKEKFSSGVEQGGTSQSDATATRSSETEMVNNGVNMETSSSTTNQRRSDDSSHQQNHGAHNVGKQNRTTTEQSVPQTSKDNNNNINNRESSSRTYVKTAHEVNPVATERLQSGDESGIADDQQQQHTNLNPQNNNNSNSNSERVTSLEGGNENVMAAQKEAANEQPHPAGSHETAETTGPLNNWDENEQVQSVENNYDWIREISRPRSYWEDRRQAWYQEMLSTRSENEEIRRLLVRRRVSSFLASDFRETMDRLMTSRIERQMELEGYEDEEEDVISRERIGQLLLSHLQRHYQPAVSQEEEQAGGGEEEEEEDGDYIEEDEEEEEQTPTSHDQPHETSDYSDQSSSSMQMPSPTTMQSWGYQHHEVGDDHPDPVGSASSPHQDSRMSSSFTNRLSIEMELVYDLRGQMAQLHREMTDLRKSIQSCMDMQVTLQHPHPPPQEVHSVRGTENNSVDVTIKKRKCCICYEMNVDSLLYRCGHMCTCLKCAHELQWSSGKCPICRAPIADVVKAYMDS